MQNLTLVHPVSHGPLTREERGYRCLETQEFFADIGGVPCFVPQDLAAHMDEERSGLVNQIKVGLRKFPLLYRFLIFLISPICFSGQSAKRFLKKYPDGALMLNIGSGIHKPHPNVLNVDIFYYKGVDLVANGEILPFQTDTVDAIICENLLEHVPRPEKLVGEMYRVLKPGGGIYIVTPFVYPFHASPNDFYRWSSTGLKALLGAGEIEVIGTRAGPTSGLVAQLGTWFAIAFSFGIEPLYHLLSMLGLLLFFPLKFLDVVFGWFPTSIHGAGAFYAIAKKRRGAAA
jgi:SAM-dependent methyltransferase